MFPQFKQAEMKTARGSGVIGRRPRAKRSINAATQLHNVKAIARRMDLNFRTVIPPVVVGSHTLSFVP